MSKQRAHTLNQKTRLTIIVGGLVALIAVFALGAFFYSARTQEQTAQRAVDARNAFTRPNMPTLGTPMAKVQIMEFFDPACEACRAFYPHVKEVLARNEGRVRLSLRYATFHQGSEYVVKALEAARLQGQDIYWRAVEAVLAAQPVWADHGRPRPELIWEFLAKAGVDVERAKREMEDPNIAERIEQDVMDIIALEVRQTPTLFINGKPLREFSAEGLAAQVSEELGDNARK